MSSSRAVRLAVRQLSGACVVEGLRHLVERKQKLLYDAHEVEQDVRAASRGAKRYTDRTGRVTVVACAGHHDLDELTLRVQDVARRFAEIGALLRAAAHIPERSEDGTGGIKCESDQDASATARSIPSCADESGRTEPPHVCAVLAARLCAARELWLVELNFFHWDHNVAHAWPQSGTDNNAERGGASGGETRRVKVSLCRRHCCSGHRHRIAPVRRSPRNQTVVKIIDGIVGLDLPIDLANASLCI